MLFRSGKKLSHQGRKMKIMAIPVIYQLITMVILMIIGVVLQKKNFLSLANAKGLSIVLTRVAVPCNMVVLLQREYSPEIFKGFLVTCIATYMMCCIGAFNALARAAAAAASSSLFIVAAVLFMSELRLFNCLITLSICAIVSRF